MNIKDYKKTDNFQPVAMKCTEKQFNEMKPILEGFGIKISHTIGNFKRFTYLTNFNMGIKNRVNNVENPLHEDFKRDKIPYNQESFLKACGIERIKYPEINLSKITPDLIRELNKDPNIHNILVKEGVIKPKFEARRWYKFKNALCFYESKEKQYGIHNDGSWIEKCCWLNYDVLGDNENWIQATPAEVIERLKAEAVKKGFVEGAKVKSLWKDSVGTLDLGFKTDLQENGFWMGGYCLMKNGIWATIINEPKPAYIQVPISEIDNLSSKKLGRFVKELRENY